MSGEHTGQAHQLGVKGLLVVDGIEEVDAYHLAFIEAEHQIGGTGNDGQGCFLTQHGGLHAILHRGRAPALDMSQHRDTSVNAGLFLDDLAQALDQI